MPKESVCCKHFKITDVNNYAQENCAKEHKIIYDKNDKGQITVICLGYYGRPKCKDYEHAYYLTLEEMKERFCKPV